MKIMTSGPAASFLTLAAAGAAPTASYATSTAAPTAQVDSPGAPTKTCPRWVNDQL